MPRRSTHDPQAIQYARDAVKAGRSVREVASELAELDVHVSHMTVARWAQAAPSQAAQPKAAPALVARVKARRERAAKPPAPAAPPPPAAAPPAPAPADDEPFDFESRLQSMIREAETEARQHDAASNPRGAQAAMRRAAELMKVLSQSEKRKPADPDQLVFSRSEIDRAAEQMTETLANLCARPVLCSECSRELSVKFGRGE